MWSEVDRYLEGALLPSDPLLDQVLSSSSSAGLPSIQVSPTQGQLLALLCRLRAARRVLEIGTLGGYSSIWMGRTLPRGGRLISLEISPKHAEVARSNLSRAGLGSLVEVRVGPALASLERLALEGGAPFDLIFIDADKENCAPYFAWALRLARAGTVIVVDNVVRGGDVARAESADPSSQGVRRLLEAVRTEPRVTATAVQTVGIKGHDGLLVALVGEEPGGLPEEATAPA